ncbi:MAG: cytochrome c maturation protein CcmE [Firmicutes bacterium]|nr:cytochrome c maturation protein CcmE [Bacillota bacterium]
MAGSNQKIKLAAGILIILGGLAYLMVTGFSSSSSYFVTIAQMREKGDTIVGKSLKVSGKIVGQSVKWDSQKIRLNFEIRDDKGQTIPVVYNGIKPDNFEDGKEALMDGRLGPDGVFTAQSLLVKCPSKYEAEKKDKNGGA